MKTMKSFFFFFYAVDGCFLFWILTYLLLLGGYSGIRSFAQFCRAQCFVKQCRCNTAKNRSNPVQPMIVVHAFYYRCAKSSGWIHTRVCTWDLEKMIKIVLLTSLTFLESVLYNVFILQNDHQNFSALEKLV